MMDNEAAFSERPESDEARHVITEQDLQRVIHERPQHPVSILARSILTNKEKKIGSLANWATFAYLQLDNIGHLHHKLAFLKDLEISTHETSVAGSFFLVGAFVLSSEMFASRLAQKGNEKKGKIYENNTSIDWRRYCSNLSIFS